MLGSVVKINRGLLMLVLEPEKGLNKDELMEGVM